MDKEKLIKALMCEYGLSREAAEERAEKTIAALDEYNNTSTDSEEDEEIAYDVSEVMCCKCFERWIAVRPTLTMLKDMECPRCKFTGAVIETGQEFYLEEDIENLYDDEGDDDDC